MGRWHSGLAPWSRSIVAAKPSLPGLDDQAVRDLREAARISPTAPQPLEALGKLYDERGDARAGRRVVSAGGRPASRRRSRVALLAGARALPFRRAGRGEGTTAPRAGAPRLSRGSLPLRSRRRAMRETATRRWRRSNTPSGWRQPSSRRAKSSRISIASGDDRTTNCASSGHCRRSTISCIGTSRLASRRRAPVSSPRPDDVERRRRGESHRLTRARRDRPRAAGEAEHTGERRMVARALAVLERALGGTARRSEGLALYGRALYLSGDLLAAERILQEALSTSPIDQEAFGFLADAAERARHPASPARRSSTSTLSRATRLRPSSAAVARAASARCRSSSAIPKPRSDT